MWPKIRPLVKKAAMSTFDIIALKIKKDFICAGSFPASVLASVWSKASSSNKKVKLIFNDIDVYYGEFQEGVIQSKNCT